MRIRVALGLLVASTVGCDSPGKPSVPAPGASASTAAASPSGSTAASESSCDKQVADLERWTATLLAEGDPVVVAADMKMPEVDQKPNGLYFKQPSFIGITDTMLLIDGKPGGSPKDIAERVMKFDEVSSELKKKQDKAGDVVIAASPEARWAVVASVAATVADASYDSVVFAFRSRQGLPAPKSELLSRAVDPSQKAPVLDKDGGSQDKVFGQCPDASAALQKAIDPSAVATPKQVVEQFIKVLPGALRACQCKVNMEDVRATLWTRLRGVGDSAAYTVRVLVAKPADAQAAELSDAADAAWATAHKKIIALAGATDRYRLTITK